MNFEKMGDIIGDAYERMLIPTPSINFKKWPKFSSILKGLRPKEYTILCGSTGSGKTTFIAAMVADLIAQDIPTYVASVETGRIDFMVRTMSALVQKNWNLGEPIDPKDLSDFKNRFPWFDCAPLYLARYEDRVPNKQVLGDIEEAVTKCGVKIAVLDNLNFFMEVTRHSDQILEMDRVIHDAIIFCKQVDVHLIVVMHPRKTDDTRVLSEFDIKGSSTAVQEAHNIWLFNRPPKAIVEKDREIFKDFREIKIAKCRRYGKHVGDFISFKCIDGVDYKEERYDAQPMRYAAPKSYTF